MFGSNENITAELRGGQPNQTPPSPKPHDLRRKWEAAPSAPADPRASIFRVCAGQPHGLKTARPWVCPPSRCQSLPPPHKTMLSRCISKRSSRAGGHDGVLVTCPCGQTWALRRGHNSASNPRAHISTQSLSSTLSPLVLQLLLPPPPSTLHNTRQSPHVTIRSLVGPLRRRHVTSMQPSIPLPLWMPLRGFDRDTMPLARVALSHP